MTRTAAGGAGAAGAADPRYAVVYDESLRALREQQEALREVRGHAAQLLAAASVSVSFLGGLAYDGGPAAGWGTAVAVVAGVSFLAMVALCVWIMLPRDGWSLVFRPSALLSRVNGDRPMPLGVMYATLALAAEEHLNKTQEVIAQRQRGLRVAAVLLGVAVTSWGAALIGG